MRTLAFIIPLFVAVSCGSPAGKEDSGAEDSAAAAAAAEKPDASEVWEKFGPSAEKKADPAEAKAGMTFDEVTEQFGMPVQRTVLPGGQEEWIYRSRIVKFRNGKVISSEPRP